MVSGALRLAKKESSGRNAACGDAVACVSGCCEGDGLTLSSRGWSQRKRSSRGSQLLGAGHQPGTGAHVCEESLLGREL